METFILGVASGEIRTKVEIDGYYDMGILHDGITL